MFPCQECEVERSNGLSMAIHQKIEHDMDTEYYDKLELLDDVKELQKELQKVRHEIQRRVAYTFG